MLAYLTGSVTQGSADAFAESEIATALSGIGNVAFRVREILLAMPGIGAVNSAQVQVAISRRSKSAMPLITDRDVLFAHTERASFLTSGLAFQNQIVRAVYGEDDELLIVEDPLYLQIDSANTSASNVALIRIGYERVSISAVDRLTLLTQSLE